jgi:hypothetical protein
LSLNTFHLSSAEESQPGNDWKKTRCTAGRTPLYIAVKCVAHVAAAVMRSMLAAPRGAEFLAAPVRPSQVDRMSYAKRHTATSGAWDLDGSSTRVQRAAIACRVRGPISARRGFSSGQCRSCDPTPG